MRAKWFLIIIILATSVYFSVESSITQHQNISDELQACNQKYKREDIKKTLIPSHYYFQRSYLRFFHFSENNPTLSKISHAPFFLLPPTMEEL